MQNERARKAMWSIPDGLEDVPDCLKLIPSDADRKLHFHDIC